MRSEIDIVTLEIQHLVAAFEFNRLASNHKPAEKGTTIFLETCLLNWVVGNKRDPRKEP